MKTITSIKQKKIDSIIQPSNILEIAKTWRPVETKRKRKSILHDHIDTIRYLRSARKMSYKNIFEFFNQNGVKVSYANVIAFSVKNKIGGSRRNKKEEIIKL